MEGYKYLSDEQLQGALGQYLHDKQAAINKATRTAGMMKRDGVPAVETRTPTQILLDDVANGGPQVVQYNKSTLIFGTCDLSSVYRMTFIFIGKRKSTVTDRMHQKLPIPFTQITVTAVRLVSIVQTLTHQRHGLCRRFVRRRRSVT